MTAPNPIRTAIVEDQKLFREMLVRLVTLDPQFHLVGQTQDGTEGWEMIRREHPDLVVVDLEIPGLNGFDLVECVRSTPETAGCRVLAVTSHFDPITLGRLGSLRVHGFVEKDQSLDILEAAMIAVGQGGTYFTPLFELRRQEFRQAAVDLRQILSSRECEILQGVASGLTCREIGESLGISTRTVENHRHRIIKKLDLRSGADLVHFAFTKGFSWREP